MGARSYRNTVSTYALCNYTAGCMMRANIAGALIPRADVRVGKRAAGVATVGPR